MTGSPDPSWPPRPPEWRHDAPDPPDAFGVPWSWGDGILLAIWSLGAQITAVVPFQAAGIDVMAGRATYAFLLTAQVVTIVGALLWLHARGGLSWRLLGPLRPAWRHVLVGIGVGVSGFVVVTLLLALTSAAFGGFEPPDQPVLQRSMEGGYALALGIVTAVVVAPVVEEFIFRSVLFQALRGRAGLWPAIGISAFVFGLVHFLAPPYIVALVMLGFWLAAAFHRTGSLVVPVVGHAVFNATAIAMVVLAG